MILAADAKKRLEPYCTDSFFDVLTELKKWNLREVAGQIECPMLITDPADEQFWPGQSKELFDLLKCEKKLAPFDAVDGANWHCEPMAQSVRSHVLIDWIADHFG